MMASRMRHTALSAAASVVVAVALEERQKVNRSMPPRPAEAALEISEQKAVRALESELKS